MINYFKNDIEIKGKCHYCGKYTEKGNLFLKQSYGDLWTNPKSKKILVCSKSKCYNKSRKDYNVGALSKKQIQYYNLIFFTILLTFVLIFIFIY